MKLVIENNIQSAIAALQEEGELPKDIDIRVQVERTRDEKYGHFACNIAMMLAKEAGTAPRDLAEEIVKRLPPSEHIIKVNIAGPGFINFYLSEHAFYDVIKDVFSAGDHYGQSDQGKGQRVYLEFVSANPTGPLHVGHGRSAAYGACVGNLLTAVGYDVHREYYVNDAGRQMRILALSVWYRYLEILGEAVELPANAYQGQYIINIAGELAEKYQDKYRHPFAGIESSLPTALVEKQRLFDKLSPEEKKEHQAKYIDKSIEVMGNLLNEDGFEVFKSAALENILADIKEDLEEFGVIFDEWFRESRLFKEGLIEKGIELLKSAGHVFEKEGALWFRATDYGDTKDRVLLRADGQPTYFASDVAYHLYKYQQDYDQVIDIFGADHHGYIQRIRAFLKGLDQDPNKLDVLLVQFAILYRGKEKVKMSTRSGEFVTLRELRNEVGNDAARYFYIMRKPEQHLDFDLELAKSHSNENPVYYIQYAHARICSVWKQLKNNKIDWNKDNGIKNLAILHQDIELSLMNMLSQYPEVVLNAATHHEPHTVANFLQNFANLFHSYYNSSRFIIDETDLRDARLCLIAAVQQVIKNGLLLLGLSAPESM